MYCTRGTHSESQAPSCITVCCTSGSNVTECACGTSIALLDLLDDWHFSIASTCSSIQRARSRSHQRTAPGASHQSSAPSVSPKRTFAALSMNWVCGIAAVFHTALRLGNLLDLCLGNLLHPAQHGHRRSSRSYWITGGPTASRQ